MLTADVTGFLTGTLEYIIQTQGSRTSQTCSAISEVMGLRGCAAVLVMIEKDDDVLRDVLRDGLQQKVRQPCRSEELQFI